MEYIITSHTIIYRTYLVQDVDSIEGALDKYYEELPDPIKEEYSFESDDTEIELLTPELRIQYGLEGG
jgi:hypothetical protein